MRRIEYILEAWSHEGYSGLDWLLFRLLGGAPQGPLCGPEVLCCAPAIGGFLLGLPVLQSNIINEIKLG